MRNAVMVKVRNLLAETSRRLPRVRGKGPVGVRITRLLTDYRRDEDCFTVLRMRDGTKMCIDVRSRTEEWTYWTGEYDYEMVGCLASCLTPESVVFDVGANVGFYAVALGNRLKGMGGHGKVYAVEPVPTNYERLVQNININGLQQVVTPIRVAIGKEEGEVQLALEDANHASTGSATMINTAKTDLQGNVSARLARLETIVEEYGIKTVHLIKIDVEGAELMFFQGGADFLGRHRPIIYGEFSSSWMHYFGHSVTDVAKIVASWDYRYFIQVGRKEFKPVPLIEHGMEDLLLAPADTPAKVLAGMGVIGTL